MLLAVAAFAKGLNILDRVTATFAQRNDVVLRQSDFWFAPAAAKSGVLPISLEINPLLIRKATRRTSDPSSPLMTLEGKITELQ
jgi:hypothetical protein